MKRSLALLLAAGLLSACAGPSGDQQARGPGDRGATGRAPAAPFLCSPGASPNPCELPLSYRSVPPVGEATTVTAVANPDPKVDCFFAYPTLSNGPGRNAPARATDLITRIAQADAAAFGTHCRVFVPLYAQATMPALGEVLAGRAEGRRAMDVAYRSLLAGWQDYLANRSQGRPFVLIGHSQGAALLIRLIRDRIDASPALRDRLISAYLVGANLTVPKGKLVGGAFANVPLCDRDGQTGCAVAFSAFYDPPPANATFAIAGQGVGKLWGQEGAEGLEVACVNPASFLRGVARLNPRWLEDPGSATPFTTYPGLYRAECRRNAEASWLGVTVLPASSYPAQVRANDRPVAEATDASWGLHASEFSLTLGDLVNLLGRQVFTLHQAR